MHAWGWGHAFGPRWLQASNIYNVDAPEHIAVVSKTESFLRWQKQYYKIHGELYITMETCSCILKALSMRANFRRQSFSNWRKFAFKIVSANEFIRFHQL